MFTARWQSWKHETLAKLSLRVIFEKLSAKPIIKTLGNQGRMEGAKYVKIMISHTRDFVVLPGRPPVRANSFNVENCARQFEFSAAFGFLICYDEFSIRLALSPPLKMLPFDSCVGIQTKGQSELMLSM